MPKYINRLGHKYGRLTVIKFVGRNEASKKQKTVLWSCDCDCGTKNHIVHARNLASGRVRSCGCLAIEQSRKVGISKALPGVEAAEKRLYNKYKNLAKKRKIKFSLTIEEFLSLVYSPCYYCGTEPSGHTTAKRRYLPDVKIIHNGVDRVNSSQSYCKPNCVPCCKNCNWVKLDLSLSEFKSHIKKIALHMNLI